MKKVLSLFLSLTMLFSLTAGIDFSASAAYETMGTARSYTLGETMTGYFTSNDTVDFIRFTLPSSGRVQYICSGTEGYFTYLYEQNNSGYIDKYYIYYDSNLGMAYGDSHTVALTAGTYYLRVKGTSNENYSIQMNFTSANENFYESNTAGNNIIGNANAISLGTVYTGLVGGVNDEWDFYAFTVDTGSYNIHVKADNDLSMYIYTMTGERVDNFSAYVNNQTGYAQAVTSISLNAGTYCIRFSNGSACGSLFTFSISVPAPAASGTTTQSVAATTVSKPKTTSIKKLTKGKKQFKITWKKVSGVSGYQVQYSTSKKFTKKKTKTVTVKSNKAKSPSKTIKKLKSKKTYYVRVRTYKTVKVNGKSTKVYSKWSKVKSVKTK